MKRINCDAKVHNVLIHDVRHSAQGAREGIIMQETHDFKWITEDYKGVWLAERVGMSEIKVILMT